MADEQRTLTANFTADSSGFATATNQVIQRLRELNTHMAETKNAIKETNSQLREYEKELARMRQATNNGENATEEQRREMQQLEDAIAQCNVDLGVYRTSQQRLQSEIRSTNRQLDEQRNNALTVSQAFLSMGDVLKANLLSGAITNGLQELLYLLKTLAGYAYNVGSSFEASMSQVGANSGTTGAELDALTAKAKEMGASTKFTATQAAEALNYMAMAGWKTQDMLSGIDGVINLAAASGEDLGAVSDIVTDALTAFGLSAKDSAHFADVLAAASANSNTNVAMMGETFSYAAPIAGALGYSIEDTAVAIGIMANSGIKASQAGTALRTIMTNLASDVKIAGENIGEVTINTTNADGSMREFADIIADLRIAFSGLSESEKTATAESIAGKYAMSGFLSLMNAGEQDVAKLTAAIESCEGATSQMADTMQNNLKGSVTVMRSALEGLGISLYDKFSGGLKEAVDILTDGIGQLDESVGGGALDNSLDRLSDSFVKLSNDAVQLGTDALPDLINGIADTISFVVEFREEIGAGIGAFVAYKSSMALMNTGAAFVTSVRSIAAAFRSVTTATEAATAAQTANNAAAAANPYMLVAAAIGVMIGTFSALISNLDDCNEKMRDLNSSAKEGISTAEEYKKTADGLRDVADEYKNINSSVENAVDKNTRLRSIQQQLIDQYGEQAAGIDLVNGAYDEQLSKLEALISKNSELHAEGNKQAVIDVQKAENEKTAIKYGDWDYGAFSFDDRERKASEVLTRALAASETFNSTAGNHIYLSGTYEQRIAALQAVLSVMDNAGLRDTQIASDIYSQLVSLDSAKTQRDYVLSASSLKTSEPYDPTAHYRSKGLEEEARKAEISARLAAERETAQLTAEQRAEQYKSEKQLADDLHSIRELSDKEYYAKLERLRDAYLEKNSHEWYTATAELIRLSDSIASSAEKTAERISDAMGEIKQTYQELINAIDSELEKREREKQDNELQSQIDAVSARLMYENIDEYSRIALEKELRDLQEKREDMLYKRSATDSKAQIQAAYTASQGLMGLDLGGFDPNAWQSTVNAAFAQISEGYMPNASAKDKMEAAAVYNYITINAENKTPQQIYNELKPYIGGGI